MRTQVPLTAMAAVLAAVLLGGCTTSGGRHDRDDGYRASDTDISKADLVAGKTQFRDANYGLGRTAFPQGRRIARRQCRSLDGAGCRPTTSSAVSTSPTAPTTAPEAGRPQAADRQQHGLFAAAARQQEEGPGVAAGSKSSMVDTTVVDANLALLKKT